MTAHVLVTGSRAWSDYGTIYQALVDVYARVGALVVVHGACPCQRCRQTPCSCYRVGLRPWGADAIADQAGTELGCIVERHPAQWSTYGRAAGFRRNAEMVATRPALCLAFILNNSRGASHTRDLAKASGIPTLEWLRSDGGPTRQLRPVV